MANGKTEDVFQEFSEEFKDIEVAAEAPDTAQELTSWMVLLTSVLLIGAIIVIELGLKKWFDCGLFGGGGGTVG